jgi:HD-like signal output (HDOD) protein
MNTVNTAAETKDGGALKAPPPPVPRLPEPVSAKASPARPANISRVLFVGGTASWFEQVERDLLGLQPGWYCSYAGTRAKALATLKAAAFQAVVLNGQMGEAPEFLTAVEKNHPQTLRLVRCDLQNPAKEAEWKRPGAITVNATDDAAALATTLNRTWRLQGWLAEPAIKRLLPLLRKLPAAPKLHARITQELGGANGSIEVVAHLIAQDPVMTAKILQVANSAFFGLSYQINDATEAVMFLGTERTRALILLAGVFSQFDNLKCPGFSLEPVWSHSLLVGVFARAIALAQTNDVKTSEAAFTAGLLHDVGKLILAGNVPDRYIALRRSQTQKGQSQREAELEVLGTTHSELGACLLGTWGLALPIIEAIAWHHCPEHSADTGFSLLAAVHAANVLAQESGRSADGNTARSDQINEDYLSRLGLFDRTEAWRKLCNVQAKTAEVPAQSA